jgi:pyruvate dehydrogenase complex dehydrogenase (E1) component
MIPYKVYAAYAAAVKHTGQPTVILAKTIKGYGMGKPVKRKILPINRKRWELLH